MDFLSGEELVIGGVSAAILIPLLITAFTKFIMPLTETQIQAAKGILTLVSYGIMMFLTQKPEFNDEVTLGVTFIMIFLASTGVYSEGKKFFPQIKSRIKNEEFDIKIVNSQNLVGTKQGFTTQGTIIEPEMFVDVHDLEGPVGKNDFQ